MTPKSGEDSMLSLVTDTTVPELPPQSRQAPPQMLAELDNDAESAGALCHAWRRFVFELPNLSRSLSAPLNLLFDLDEEADEEGESDIKSSAVYNEVRFPAPPIP